jgi:Calx-beta domain
MTAPRRFWILTVLAVVGATLTMAVASADGAAPPAGKPVIGKPVAAPTQPVAGTRFVALFKVTQSGTGASLVRGTMAAESSIAGQVTPSKGSFKGGTARVSLVVPPAATGKQLKLRLTIKAGKQSATRVTIFRVQGTPMPAASIGDVSVTEGTAGATTLSFPVTLSTPAKQAVTVGYATADGTAKAPDDYAATSGTLTFRSGEKSKTISVNIQADDEIEQDETLTMTLSNPVKATLGAATATGTISNDDTTKPARAGSYKGATQNGNYVFFTVLGDRSVTGFRINDLPCNCDPYGSLLGGENFGNSIFAIGADATLNAESTWTGSDKQGDTEWTYASLKLGGRFDTESTVSGTIVVTYELNYGGTHYRCSSGPVTWTATLQG